MPNHFTLTFFFWLRKAQCIMQPLKSNRDLFTCEDNSHVIFTCEDIMFSHESSPGIYIII